VDAAGKLAATIERFDVGTGTFQTLSSAGLLSRSRHTATLLSEIPYATWKSMNKVLRVDHSMKGKRTTFALKAAKTNSNAILSST